VTETHADVATLFRAGLLEGRTVAVLAAGELAAAARAACERLGAEVVELRAGEVDPLDEAALAAALSEAAARRGRLEALVLDAAGLFAAAPPEGLAPLRAATDASWVAARAAGTATMIGAPGGGKLVLLAPPPGAGPHAEATRAALENLARTLSIEWARHDVRVTAVHPGAATRADEVGAVVAYLVSPAGDYFSGCVLSLGEARGD
jgi:citronellol/citronellal dehydrogenase